MYPAMRLFVFGVYIRLMIKSLEASRPCCLFSKLSGQQLQLRSHRHPKLSVVRFSHSSQTRIDGKMSTRISSPKQSGLVSTAATNSVEYALYVP